jgi:myo-inositol-1(or 4)-monophosphatase
MRTVNHIFNECDRRCEETIIAALRRKFPDDGFLGEETGAEEGRSGRCWIIDPLDGTSLIALSLRLRGVY